MRLNRSVSAAANDCGEQRLGGSGHALEQDVAADEQAREHRARWRSSCPTMTLRTSPFSASTVLRTSSRFIECLSSSNGVSLALRHDRSGVVACGRWPAPAGRPARTARAAPRVKAGVARAEMPRRLAQHDVGVRSATKRSRRANSNSRAPASMKRRLPVASAASRGTGAPKRAVPAERSSAAAMTTAPSPARTETRAAAAASRTAARRSRARPRRMRQVLSLAAAGCARSRRRRRRCRHA